jgi:Protein of unknown function (DUF1488)
MSLTRGRPLGYDNERMAFEFTMLNGGERVECQISGAAMDDLAGGKGTLPADRESQFLHLREGIEHIASTIFDEKTVLKAPRSASFRNIFENDRFVLPITVLISQCPLDRVTGSVPRTCPLAPPCTPRLVSS